MSTKISVVIPYFQRTPGILRRTLTSVLDQRLPAWITVHVVVVDDGSPAPTAPETEGLSFAPPFQLTVISQANGGVGAARNTALRFIDANTTYIAFLDSDDIWREGHLEQAVRALGEGYDFYFCDNRRVGAHNFHFTTNCPEILTFTKPVLTNGCAEVPVEALVASILKGFPTQASTVVYRRGIFPDHLFCETLRAASEDVVFFTQLVTRARNACFSPNIMVECSEGVNQYFSNLNWDSPTRLAIAFDDIVAYSFIARCVRLAPATRDWLDYAIAGYKRDFVFHCLRYFMKRRKFPPELSRMAASTRWYPISFVLTVAQIAIKKPLGLYQPR